MLTLPNVAQLQATFASLVYARATQTLYGPFFLPFSLPTNYWEIWHIAVSRKLINCYQWQVESVATVLITAFICRTLGRWRRKRCTKDFFKVMILHSLLVWNIFSNKDSLLLVCNMPVWCKNEFSMFSVFVTVKRRNASALMLRTDSNFTSSLFVTVMLKILALIRGAGKCSLFHFSPRPPHTHTSPRIACRNRRPQSPGSGY